MLNRGILSRESSAFKLRISKAKREKNGDSASITPKNLLGKLWNSSTVTNSPTHRIKVSIDCVCPRRNFLCATPDQQTTALKFWKWVYCFAYIRNSIRARGSEGRNNDDHLFSRPDTASSMQENGLGDAGTNAQYPQSYLPLRVNLLKMAEKAEPF